MNKNEIKKILKPLIKECIKEVILEENGMLSHIISEVANGMSLAPNKQVIEESHEKKWMSSVRDNNNKQALLERKKKLLDAIGNDAYGGVNIFEGTTPAPSPSSNATPAGPLSGMDPADPGVNISNIFTNKSSAIFKRMMEKK